MSIGGWQCWTDERQDRGDGAGKQHHQGDQQDLKTLE
jgi:hypothetical protein